MGVPAADSDNQLTASGYAYDGNGNPVSYAGKTFTYDPENRLTKVASGGTTLFQAGYGGDGIRAWSADPSGAVTYYVNDDGRPVSELNASGTVIANDSFGPFGLIRSSIAYGSGASSFGRTGVAGNSHYYAYDPQGSPFLVLNDGSSAGTASVLTTYEADAFGSQVAGNTAVTPASDPYVGFGSEWGYRTDAATGLELLEHRYYDPATGRFVTRDPIGYSGGADLYEYANNNPNYWADENGQSPVAIAIAVEIAEGGPEDPVADVIAGGILAGGIIIAISPHINMPEPDPTPPAPVQVRGKTSGPNPQAQGPHTNWRPGHWQTWNPQSNPKNPEPWEPGPRYDGNGSNHGGVPTPHVHDPDGTCRPAKPDEKMKND